MRKHHLFVNFLCPVLKLPVINNSIIVLIKRVHHFLDIFLDHVPQEKTVVSMVIAGQVHHASPLHPLDVVEVLPVHPLVGLGQQLLDALRAVTDRQAEVCAPIRRNEHLAAQGVDGDDEPGGDGDVEGDDDGEDEPEVLLEHLVQGVAGHEAAVHGQGKRLHEEMRVSQMCADLSHLGNRGLAN